MIKFVKTAIAAATLLASIAGSAEASLITIGQAAYNGSSYSLIWDNNSSLVWLDYTIDTNLYMSIDPAPLKNLAYNLNDPLVLSWAINSGYNLSWQGDWRLASISTINEYQHLYYDELGNLAKTATGGGLINKGPFHNLFQQRYYSGEVQIIREGMIPGTGEVIYSHHPYWFDFEYGNTGIIFGSLTGVDKGLAVRSAEVTVVPEPSTILLLGMGSVGLWIWRKRVKNIFHIKAI